MIAWVAAAFAGTLSGTVTGPGGVPAVDALVAAYDLRLSYTLTTTDGDGNFSLVVPDGPYRVRVIASDADNLAEAWAPFYDDLCTAPPYTPPAEVDVTLATGATLGGVVVDETGAPLEGVTLTTEAVDPEASLQPRVAVTDAAGAFELRGLTGGPQESPLRITAEDLTHPDQYLPGVYGDWQATSWGLLPGYAGDAGTVTLLPGISVSGTVLVDGVPLASGTATVYSAPVRDASAPSDGALLSGLRQATIQDGQYSAVGLPPGEVLSWVVASGYATTYYPDSPEPPADRVLVADEGGQATLDLDLPPESRLTGRLPGAGPFDTSSVVVYNLAKSVGVGAPVADDGTFDIGGLYGGTYTMAVYAADAGLVSGPWVDGTGADVQVDVPAEGTLDLGSLDVPLSGSLGGTARDRYSGDPVYGAYVHAESALSGSVVTATTGIDGTWWLGGLEAGDYTLWADYQAWCDADPDWLARWYPDAVDGEIPVEIHVDAGGSTTWDPNLAPDDDHDGMDDVWEEENGLDPTRDDSAEDPDGDGFTNLEEYQFGTDPTDATPARAGCGCGTSGVPSPTSLPALFGWLLARRVRAGRRRRG